MNVWYEPVKLAAARSSIEKDHKISSQPTGASISNVGVEKLVHIIADLDEERVTSYANTLTNHEMFLLAWYIPENKLHVELKNLFTILDLRATKDIFLAFFHAWQNLYWNTECNIGICNKFVKNSFFQAVMKENHLDQSKFQNVLVYELGIPDGVNVLVGKSKFSKTLSYEEKLKCFGIRSDTKLYNECLRRFYLTCKHDDYIFSETDALIGAYRLYNAQERKQLLINILQEIDWSELDNFSRLFREYNDFTGPKHREKIAVYFQNTDPDIIQKFTDWYNMNNVLRLFGEDERSLFWKNFRFEDVERYIFSNSVVMTFKEYVAVEFLGQAMGPIYIYKRDVFEKRFQRMFNIHENAELRQLLYHNSERILRKEHRGDWQFDMACYLVGNKITTRVGAYGQKNSILVSDTESSVLGKNNVDVIMDKPKAEELIVVNSLETDDAHKSKSGLDRAKFDELLQGGTISDYVDAVELLLECDLPEKLIESYQEMIKKITVLKEINQGNTTIYSIDMDSFEKNYIPDALKITAEFISYRARGFSEKMIEETKETADSAVDSVLQAVDAEINNVSRYALMEMKADAKALEAIAGQY